jgi:hypothetical protein
MNVLLINLPKLIINHLVCPEDTALNDVYFTLINTSEHQFIPRYLNIHVGSQVITTVIMKCTIFWVVTSAEHITSTFRVKDGGDMFL